MRVRDRERSWEHVAERERGQHADERADALGNRAANVRQPRADHHAEQCR
jgi:hypothetical protein